MKPIAALAVAAALTACGGGERAYVRALAELETARVLYRDAEARATRGDAEGAIRQLEKIAVLPFPPEAPEGEDVAVDALAEASRVLLGAGRAAEAERAARRAVARATRDSYFLGLAHLRLGDALRALGRGREAVEAFERSIAVNRSVLERLQAAGGER